MKERGEVAHDSLTEEVSWDHEAEAGQPREVIVGQARGVIIGRVLGARAEHPQGPVVGHPQKIGQVTHQIVVVKKGARKLRKEEMLLVPLPECGVESRLNGLL